MTKVELMRRIDALEQLIGNQQRQILVEHLDEYIDPGSLDPDVEHIIVATGIPLRPQHSD
jgi:hypothetical protein